MSDSKAIGNFYTEFQRRQLNDFIDGNLRVQMSIELVSAFIPSGPCRLLDVGCGVGTSSGKLAQRHPALSVLGVDITDANIEVASKLWANERVRFQRSDMSTVPSDETFDVVCALDVYEHIPVDNRSAFHNTVRSMLTENGIIIVTTPSPLHQNWLKSNEPEGLQIVDETVGLSDINEFAKDLGATVILHRWVDIWYTNQYCYTIMSKSPLYQPIPGLVSKLASRKFGSTRRGLHQISARVLDWLPRHLRRRKVNQALAKRS